MWLRSEITVRAQFATAADHSDPAKIQRAKAGDMRPERPKGAGRDNSLKPLQDASVATRILRTVPFFKLPNS